MPQTYWHLTGNLWALALSTVIALFLPDFGPTERMGGGVGVVIRATMAVPVVFTLLYFAGQPTIGFLTRLARRIKVLSIITAGIDRGIRKEAERMNKEERRRADEAERMAAEVQRAAAQARELEREQVRQFMLNKGVSEEEIDAFIGRLAQQD